MRSNALYLGLSAVNGLFMDIAAAEFTHFNIPRDGFTSEAHNPASITAVINGLRLTGLENRPVEPIASSDTELLKQERVLRQRHPGSPAAGGATSHSYPRTSCQCDSCCIVQIVVHNDHVDGQTQKQLHRHNWVLCGDYLVLPGSKDRLSG